MKQDFNYDILLNKLKDKDSFSWSRFGDGEWNAILQKRPEGAVNADGHQYFQDLGEALKNILKGKPEYFIGLQNLAKEQNQGNEEFDSLVEGNEWCDNEILHRASIKGRLQEFFDVLNRLEDSIIVVVGNNKLRGINTKLQYDAFIEIPEKDCWLEFDNIYKKIMAIQALEEKDIIFLYCASMMSNVLIDKNWGADLDGVTQIDCGSVFDPYVGVHSRTYHKKLKI